MDSELLIGRHENILFVKAIGHMTALVCTELRKNIVQRLQKETPPQEIVVDLSECPYMDSTFMGLLVGVNKRLSRLNKHKITIYHPTEEVQTLLEGLGLKNYLNFDFDDDYEMPAEMSPLRKDNQATADFILRAHEHLMDLSRENRRKFSTLKSVLQSQIKKGE